MNKSPIIKSHLVGLQSALLGGKEHLQGRRREYDRRYVERHPERVAKSKEKSKAANLEYTRKYNKENKEIIREHREETARGLRFDDYPMQQRYDKYCRKVGRVVDIHSSEYLEGIEDWKVNIDSGGRRGNAEWYMSHFESPRERDAYCQHCRRKGLPYKIGAEGCLDELENWRASSRKYGKKKENVENG